MAPQRGASGVDSSMDKLSINASPDQAQTVVESWDEDDSDVEEGSSIKPPKRSTHLATSSMSYPSAPPPTPMSPKFAKDTGLAGSANSSAFEDPRGARDSSSDRRPEKTTQTASRMIAAGLGVKAPKRTEEQKQYDRAVRENEAKRINQQKEERRRQEEERERAKAAMWDG